MVCYLEKSKPYDKSNKFYNFNTFLSARIQYITYICPIICFSMSRHLLSIIFLLSSFVLVHTNLAGQSASAAQSQMEYNNDDLKVFPNPATEYFQINNALSIKKVVIYNMFGKEVKVLFNQNNTQHDVTDLKSGMYIIKMLDERNKVVKSVKLQKISSGA
jgi:di/tripeptidase